MKNINIRKLYYHIRHKYITLNNIVIAVAFLIAASWAWGAVGVMQRNYALQKEITTKQQQLELAQLDTQTQELEQKYYQSPEYLEIEAKRRLNLANPGEKVLILPPNSQTAKDADSVATPSAPPSAPPSNFAQWMNFLFGGGAKATS